MFTAAAGSVAPKTRKGRTATVRPSTNLLISSGYEDNTASLRIQHLRVLGIAGQRADMFATMIWEACHG